MLTALKQEALLPTGVSDDPAGVPSMTPALCRAIHAYLARTSAWLVLANVEDGLEEFHVIVQHPPSQGAPIGPARTLVTSPLSLCDKAGGIPVRKSRRRASRP